MTKTKNTKRALLMSALSLLLCVSMLVGSTYAWFTDSVTSSGNIIKSGTLDIEMLWKDATAKGEQQTYKDASEGPIFDYDLWEPGYVEAKNIQIKNAGTLALKYQLNIVATGEVSKLADVIDVYYADGEVELTERADMAGLTKLGKLSDVLAKISTTASGNLLATESHTVTLALKMQEEADNDYQGLSIGSEFAVQLMATQLTSEVDSFDDQYDKMATIDDIDELKAALAADYDLIQLGANITVTESIIIPAGKTVAIDLAGYTMSQEKGDITAAYAMVDNKGTLTIEDSVGTGKISFADTTPYTAEIGWASNTIRNTGVLTINGGTVENVTAQSVLDYSYPHAIDVYQGSVTTINGGTVKSLNYDAIRMFCNSATLATTVNINGGTIINRVSFQDPSANVAGYGILNVTGGNFITTDEVNANVRLLNFSNVSGNMKATVTGGTFDAGFKTQDIVNAGVETSDWLYYDGADAVVATAEELQNAIDAAEDGDVILLAADITDANANTAITIASGKEVTLDLNGHKISATADKSGNQELFLVKGNMTVKNGSLELVAKNDQGWNAMATIFDITGGGVLNLDGVTADVKGTAMSFVAHLNNWGTATLNVTNSTLKSSYIAVRAFNSGKDMNNITIVNSTLEGKFCFWVHNYISEGKDDSTLNVDIYGKGNTFVNSGKAPVLYGFNEYTYYDANGDIVE